MITKKFKTKSRKNTTQELAFFFEFGGLISNGRGYVGMK
jgi:hypothetical protein